MNFVLREARSEKAVPLRKVATDAQAEAGRVRHTLEGGATLRQRRAMFMGVRPVHPGFP